jgi:Lrp/AsnC family transcriptional regulator, regulator for asnA, asnC and gidA
MNKLDLQIIEHLTKNARTSFRKIAKKTGKSTDTIINHYKELIENGDIKGSTVVIDIGKTGYEGLAAFEIDIVSDEYTSSDKILEQLIKMPNIIVATKTVGEHDLLALTVIHDLKHYQKVSVEISQIKGIKNLTSSVWSGNKKIKPEYFII